MKRKNYTNFFEVYYSNLKYHNVFKQMNLSVFEIDEEKFIYVGCIIFFIFFIYNKRKIFLLKNESSYLLKKYKEKLAKVQKILSFTLHKKKHIKMLYEKVEKKNTKLKNQLLYDRRKFEIFKNNIQLQKYSISYKKEKIKIIECSIIALREQIDVFQKQIQEKFYHSIKENSNIYYEIKHLKKVNDKIMEETVNFTQILKGNNKLQGIWGEIILSKILESAGLREGYEYQSQISIGNIENKYKPDIIIKLPKGKDIIVDSKMTLVAYEKYYNSTNKEIRKKALSEHISAIKLHLKTLSNKNYHKLPGIKSLDYVLMFIPIEQAFLIAINYHPELISEAFKLNIMIVSPTTLLMVLRTINNIWQHEQQSKNSQIIANKASKMYEKVRLILEDILSLGEDIEKTKNNYFSIIKKLSTGKGNLIKQIESFRKYGIEVKKPISPKFIDKNF